MILSDSEIIKRLTEVEPPLLYPYTLKKTVQRGMSYGLSPAGYDIRVKLESEKTILGHGDFLLATTVERFQIPNNLVGVVHDKSTWARRGITVQNTIIEPGWNGYLTLEITMHGQYAEVIYNGDPIAQVVFHLVFGEVLSPYSGKYQDQAQEPVPAIVD